MSRGAVMLSYDGKVIYTDVLADYKGLPDPQLTEKLVCNFLMSSQGAQYGVKCCESGAAMAYTSGRSLKVFAAHDSQVVEYDPDQKEFVSCETGGVLPALKPFPTSAAAQF